MSFRRRHTAPLDDHKRPVDRVCGVPIRGGSLPAAELNEWRALLSPTSWRCCLASRWLPFLPPLGLLALFALGAALGWALRWVRLHPQRTHPFA